MTVGTKSPSVQYIEDGVTTVFAAEFRYRSSADLVVQRIAVDGTITTLTLGTDYTATAGDTDAGGAVTVSAPAANGVRLRIKRRTARSQQDQYLNTGRFPSATVERDFDRAMMVDQEQDIAISALSARAFMVPDGEEIPALAAAASRKGKYLAFDPVTGAPIAVSGTAAPAGDAALVSASDIKSGGQFTTVQGFIDTVMGRSIFVEDFGAQGDPTGMGLVNDRAPIQAAIDYAAAHGISEIWFAQRNYAVWNTTRTSTFWAWGSDGCGLVIPAALAAKGITLKGLAKPHARIRFFNKDGKEFGSNWQTIAADSNPWRGHGLMVMAPAADAGAVSFTGSISGTTLTVTAVASGTLGNGFAITDAAGGIATTSICYQLTGTPGGIGTYLVSKSQTRAGGAMTAALVQDRNTICLERIWLDGGTTANGNTNWSNPVTDVPNGWDVSHKGIAFQPDRYLGDLVLRDCKITGFRGELVYASNNREAGLILEGVVELAESNGQALNPAGGHTTCPGYVRAWNCSIPIEGWLGVGNLRGEFRNMLRGGTFCGGVIDTTGSGIGFKPQRPVDARWPATDPSFELDITISSPQQIINLGSFLTGKIVAIDSTVAFGANETSGPFKAGIIDTDIEVVTVVDKANLGIGISLIGGTSAGSKLLRNVRIRPRSIYTDDAMTANYGLSDMVSYLGSGSSYGPNVVIEGGSGPSKRASSMAGTVTAPSDYYPCFRGNNFGTPTDISTTYQNVDTTPALILRGDRMVLTTSAALTNTVTAVSLPTVGVVDGHEITLVNGQGPSSNWYFSLARDNGTSGARLPATRLIGGTDSIKLRFNAVAGYWQEIVRPPAVAYITGVGSISAVTLPALAANAISAVQTITAPGAQVMMKVSMVPTNANTALEIVNPQVTATNTISYRVREVSGAAYAGGTYNFSVSFEHQRSWLA